MRVSDEPYFIENDYESIYTEPCIKFKDGLEILYKGTGVSPEKHPLKDRIRFQGCGNCKNKNGKIIYAHWIVHPMSGDRYWDYEFHCSNCRKFTQHSFAEND